MSTSTANAENYMLGQLFELTLCRLFELKKAAPINQHFGLKLRLAYEDLFFKFFKLFHIELVKDRKAKNEKLENGQSLFEYAFARMMENDYPLRKRSNLLLEITDKFVKRSTKHVMIIEYLNKLSESTTTFLTKLCCIVTDSRYMSTVENGYDVSRLLMEKDFRLIGYHYMLKFIPLYFMAVDKSNTEIEIIEREKLIHLINCHFSKYTKPRSRAEKMGMKIPIRFIKKLFRMDKIKYNLQYFIELEEIPKLNIYLRLFEDMARDKNYSFFSFLESLHTLKYFKTEETQALGFIKELNQKFQSKFSTDETN